MITNIESSSPILDSSPSIHLVSPSPINLITLIRNYDCLCSIRYITKDTFKTRWFLVTIVFKTIDELNMNPKSTGDYYMKVLSRHPSDSNLCDNKSRWWLLWYEFKRNSKGIPIYGERILFLSSRTCINSKKFMLWSDSILIISIDVYLNCFFSFDAKTGIIKPNQFIARNIANYCGLLGIILFVAWC